MLTASVGFYKKKNTISFRKKNDAV